ncbi:MAG: hypothetical protein K2H53_04270 [Clostridia bacterium]|nr:hypothetical protein [Clostridia bacterium]
MSVPVFVCVVVFGGAALGCGLVVLFIHVLQQSGKSERDERRKNIEDSYNKIKEEREKLINKKYRDNEYSIGNFIAIYDNKLCELEYLASDIDFYIRSTYSKLPTIDHLEEITDIDDIKYYRQTGEETERQYISGGGGGGSSIGGAVVGGLVAGNVGAIIGSRKKTDEIKTTYKKVDNRRTIITLKDGRELDKSMSIYELLLRYVPEKDYDNYIDNLKSKGKK